MSRSRTMQTKVEDGMSLESPEKPVKLMIIIASTRPGRVGLPVGRWFTARVEEQGGFDIDLVDLAELGLPFMDEPNHPRLHQYTKQHTKDWSARVEAAEAFVFVMPEYNYGFTAPLKNAIDFLSQEWQYKPVGFVTYGGIAAGTRALQLIKPVLSALKLVAVTEAVNIPFVAKSINDEGAFEPADHVEHAVPAMLKELRRWAENLGEMRGAT
jgi:NAD(P)H-dependent FMN reductase